MSSRRAAVLFAKTWPEMAFRQVHTLSFKENPFNHTSLHHTPNTDASFVSIQKLTESGVAVAFCCRRDRLHSDWCAARSQRYCWPGTQVDFCGGTIRDFHGSETKFDGSYILRHTCSYLWQSSLRSRKWEFTRRHKEEMDDPYVCKHFLAADAARCCELRNVDVR